jgi:hypothetical protein
MTWHPGHGAMAKETAHDVGLGSLESRTARYSARPIEPSQWGTAFALPSTVSSIIKEADYFTALQRLVPYVAVIDGARSPWPAGLGSESDAIS